MFRGGVVCRGEKETLPACEKLHNGKLCIEIDKQPVIPNENTCQNTN